VAPDPQTIYRDAEGRVLMYVRTEQRSGRKKPEHLFVTTRNRGVFQLWVEEIPKDAELVLDTDGRRQAQEALWLCEAEEHEKRIVIECLKQACDWLPAERAKELRAKWKEAQP
jgi:hypothetical protein